MRQGRAAPAGGGGAIDFSGCVLSSRENNRLDDTVATITESCDPILLPETSRQHQVAALLWQWWNDCILLLYTLFSKVIKFYLTKILIIGTIV